MPSLSKIHEMNNLLPLFVISSVCMEKKRSLLMPPVQTNWKVLLIGGSSGVGKSSVARQLGRHLGTSWLAVDDLRLALQRSRTILPEKTEALYFFEETQEVWSLPPDQLRDRLIALGQVMSPALEVVIENHVDTADPVVIEGDAVLPSLFTRPSVRARTSSGQVQAVFLVEPEEDVLLAHMDARYRVRARHNEAQLRAMAHVRWLHGRWLADEARSSGLPVLEPHPWETLAQRIVAALR
jgi:2-phosphoglycerate kinase